MRAQPTVDQRALSDVGRLAAWTFAWVATLALARFGPIHLWDHDPVIGWIAIAVNLVVGVGWIIAHARYLRGVDDLQRKIMLDAIAVALGVGLVAGFAAAAASNVGLIAFDPDIAVFTALMAAVYIIAVAVGTLRYR
ncbi:hypothetical protein [Agromyces sp. Marseille-Q5079]|uniref:hypothetical protein n=1 Tax=Agromyces sp. Marseille-Q5079 TaxID=3439059 RepID=UPI003D9C8050